jgi:hypothetical protein
MPAACIADRVGLQEIVAQPVIEFGDLLFLFLASSPYILSVSAFVRLNILESTLLVSDCVQFLARLASMAGSRHRLTSRAFHFIQAAYGE